MSSVLQSFAGLNIQNIPDDAVILGGQFFVDIVQVVAGDQLDLGDDVVLVTEVNAVLSLWETTDQRSSDALLLEHERQLHHGVRREDQTQLDEDTLASQERQVGVEVMVSRDSVQNQIQTAPGTLHTLSISGHHKVISSNLPGSSLLVGRGGDGGDSVTHGLGNPDTHLTQSSNTHNAHSHPTIVGLTMISEHSEYIVAWLPASGPEESTW